MTKRTKRRALGQHFLKSQAVLNKIIRCISPHKDDLIVEIGAGKGALTFPLAEKAGKVIAIEKDPALIPDLRKKAKANLTILEEDILKLNFQGLLKEEKADKAKIKLVGNIPYSLTSPLLFKVLAERRFFSECIFLLQKEVAERVCAKPGSKKYAPLSILLQIHFLTRLHFIVPPESFSPPPKVNSALISLNKRKTPLFIPENEELFRNFLKAAFQHRRKFLQKNLNRLGFSPSLINDVYSKLNLDKNVRPEQLSISQYTELFCFLYSHHYSAS